MSLGFVIVVVIILIMLNALYVAAEFATISARRTRVKALAEQGDGMARRLLPYLEDNVKLDRYIAACQVGITISSLLVGFYGQAQLAPVFAALPATLAVILALVILTSLQVIFGELLPKSIALRFPERLALLTTMPMVWSLGLLRPFIDVLNGSALALLRLANLAQDKDMHAHSPEELELIFKDSAHVGYIDADEREMLENTLMLEQRLARQIMIPRSRMVTLTQGLGAQQALDRMRQTPHTRFPVQGKNIDHLVGLVHLKDVFLLSHDQPDATLDSILRPLPLIPETNTVEELWQQMQREQSYMAALFDEYGGTVGLVTFEDIIEEIVGEVQDEFDAELHPIRERDDMVLLRGDVLVSVVNKRYGLKLDEHAADTVGGLLFDALGHDPQQGEQAQLAGVRLKAIEVEANAITVVGLEAPEVAESEVAEQDASEVQS